MSKQSKSGEAAPPLGYSVNGFCRAIPIGRTKFYDLLRQGKIRTVKIGGKRIVPATEAQRLLEEDAA